MREAKFNPVVAFGFKALTLCLKAKGGSCTMQEAEALIEDAQRLLPDDERAASAAGIFAGVLQADQQQAADGLDHFLSTWRGGAMRDQLEKTEGHLRDMAPDHFDWQDRKDCGSD